MTVYFLKWYTVVVCCCIQLFCDPMDCSLPDSSVHGIFQARILAWAAISFSRASSCSKDRIYISCGSCLGKWVLYQWAIWEACLCCVLKVKNFRLTGSNKEYSGVLFSPPTLPPVTRRWTPRTFCQEDQSMLAMGEPCPLAFGQLVRWTRPSQWHTKNTNSSLDWLRAAPHPHRRTTSIRQETELDYLVFMLELVPSSLVPLPHP